MRIPSVLAALALPLAAAPAQAPRDWSANVVATPAGAWVIGNPAARVKLVEWGSYTCSHCAHFATESRTVLEGRMIRSGSTSLEVRHLIRDPLDFTAVAVARCGGPRGFVRRHYAIMDGQSQWLEKGAAFVQTNAEALNKLARPVAFRRIADGAGLTAIGQANGLTAPQVAACFTPAALDRLSKLGDPPAEVQGTPYFFVNGKAVPGVGWDGLQPVLAAAGAR